MKKILAFIVCIVLVCAMPLVAFAEEADTDAVGEGEPIVDILPSEDEEVIEGEFEGEESTPEPTPEEQAEITTEKIVAWVQANLEEISVIITMILTVFYQVRKHAVLNKSIGTLNNNSIAVAKNSETAIEKALTEVASVASMVNGYKDEITSLLAEVRANDEEKQKLKEALTEVHTHLKSAKLANMELANEVAELLVLANIPNSKKEELYSRHLAAVGAIADAEKTEVKDDDKQEA
jgi:hypothetical protein